MRYTQFLRQRYQLILGYIGLISVITGIVIIAPLLVLIAFPEEVGIGWGFLLPGLLLSFAGFFLWRFLSPQKGESLSLQEGAVIAVLSWVIAIAFGTIPFLTVGGLNFTQAVFESTSGWTTTGLSVVDVTEASALILLYRSTIELAGGAGLAIITLSAIAGPVGIGITSAEGRSEQLAPNVRRSAKLVLSIYSGYVAIAFVALWVAGMSWFDAINHAFAAMSTGGFSTRPESIGYWDSPVIEAVTIILMLFASLNFVTSYLLLKGNWKAVIRNGEVKLQAIVIPIAALILFLGIGIEFYPTLGKAVRVAIFETVTNLSTTGFATVGYTEWFSIGWLVLIPLMFIGGGAGSTAGGVKQYRIYVVYRALWWEIKRMLLPKSAITEPDVWQGDRRQFLNDEQIRAIALFILLYFVVYGIGVLVTASYGYSVAESLFEYASTLSTVGTSVGVTAADAPVGLLWTQIMGMFLGRLEFFTVFVGIIRILKNLPPILKLRK